ncbi:hypothetical protein SBA4_5010008 [Candidatus Sulfopaludibacter sp. SbA4]|nr:hypothetical protein SBA4_5010008 [Candidatus Sulfopaludibacter sp. SbA4]
MIVIGVVVAPWGTIGIAVGFQSARREHVWLFAQFAGNEAAAESRGIWMDHGSRVGGVWLAGGCSTSWSSGPRRWP